MNKALRILHRDLFDNILSTLQTGDIILTSSNGIIVSIMQLFSKTDTVNWGHCMLVKDTSTAWEAKLTIRESDIKEVLKDKKDGRIIRKKDITEDHKKEMFKLITPLIGKDYGYFRLVLFLLDKIFKTTVFTGTNTCEINQVCSSLVALIFDKCMGYKFNGIDWKSCDPDDIEDDYENNKNSWEIISENLPIK